MALYQMFSKVEQEDARLEKLRQKYGVNATAVVWKHGWWMTEKEVLEYFDRYPLWDRTPPLPARNDVPLPRLRWFYTMRDAVMDTSLLPLPLLSPWHEHPRDGLWTDTPLPNAQ